MILAPDRELLMWIDVVVECRDAGFVYTIPFHKFSINSDQITLCYAFSYSI